MILSDRDIKHRLKDSGLDIDPLDEELQIQPASVDLRLGNEFLEFRHTNISYIDASAGMLESENELDRLSEEIEDIDIESYDESIKNQFKGIIEKLDDVGDRDKIEDYTRTKRVDGNKSYILHPGDFVLGTTEEKIRLPDDLVGRVEGRSSLGRLAIVVHASLPSEEKIFFWTEKEGYRYRQISEIVEKKLEGYVVSFNPKTKKVNLFKVTDFIKNPKKEIYKVKTKQGREVKITEDHNLFTLDDNGDIKKIKTQNVEGRLIALPGKIPVSNKKNPKIDLYTLFKKEESRKEITVYLEKQKTVSNQGVEYLKFKKLSLDDVPENLEGKIVELEIDNQRFNRYFEFTPSFGFISGLFISKGYIDGEYIIFQRCNNNQIRKIQEFFGGFNIDITKKPVEKGLKNIEVKSEFFVRLFKVLSINKRRLKGEFWNMTDKGLEELLKGIVNSGDNVENNEKTVVYTSNKKLGGDIIYLSGLLGRNAILEGVENGDKDYKIEINENSDGSQEVPIPSSILSQTRKHLSLSIGKASKDIFEDPNRLDYIENQRNRIKKSNLQKIVRYYQETLSKNNKKPKDKDIRKNIEKLNRIVNSDLLFDKVIEVQKTGRKEKNYDLEVRPEGRKIENFLGGLGGIFLSNTAGYVDPGFKGNITLELSNLGKAPIALKPGMRIAQIVFEELKSPSESPYGEKEDSKYQGQKGPTESKIEKDKEWN